jgi:hypothetical protein
MYTIRALFCVVVLGFGSNVWAQGAYVGETSGVWIGGIYHICTVISPQGQLHCVPG